MRRWRRIAVIPIWSSVNVACVCSLLLMMSIFMGVLLMVLLRFGIRGAFREVALLIGHNSSVESIFVDDQYIYSGSSDRTLRVWDKETFEEVLSFRVFDRPAYPVNSVFVDARYVYAVGISIVVFDKRTFERVAIIEEANQIHSIFVDGKYIYSDHRDGTIGVWDKNAFKMVTVFESDLDYPHSVFVDDEYIYGGLGDLWGLENFIKVWDKKTFREVDTKKLYDNVVSAIFTDDKFLYVGTSFGSPLRVLNKGTLETVMVLWDQDISISSVFVDNKYVYGGLLEGTIKIWDKKTLKEIATLERHKDSIRTIFVDDKYIYSGSGDGTIGVWNKRSFRRVALLRGFHGCSYLFDCGFVFGWGSNIGFVWFDPSCVPKDFYWHLRKVVRGEAPLCVPMNSAYVIISPDYAREFLGVYRDYARLIKELLKEA